MRKLIYSINVSIDGCCDHTKGIAYEDVHDFYTNLLGQSDVLVYGRTTYELMVPFWPDVAKKGTGYPDSTIAFAKAFDAVKQYVVFSKTLEATDNKTKVFRTGLKEEILKLKQQEGKNMLLGGVDVAFQLIELGLVDEYQFIIQPQFAGEGRRLTEIKDRFGLQLIESRPFPSGCVLLKYIPSRQ